VLLSRYLKNVRKDETGMKIIGLTGSVGSGKTTVAKVMEEEFGARLLITDEIGHMFMEPGKEGYDGILEEFGEDVLGEVCGAGSGEKKKIDRKKLGAKVFGKPERMEVLNGIIHPLVNRYVAEVIEEERKKGKLRYLVIESALLIEAGYEKICDELWYVTAEDEVRRQRLKASRGYSDEKIDNILKNQLSDEIFRKKCAKVLKNNGGFDEILQEIKVLLEL
jgi:dephospho-CoA kinase